MSRTNGSSAKPGRGRLSPQERVRLTLELGADNEARSASDKSHNRRFPVRSSVTQLHIPARNQQAADGTTFTGLPGNRLQEKAVGSTELSSSASDDSARAVIRHAIRNKAVNVEKLDDNLSGINAKIPDSEIHLDKTRGTLRTSQVPNLSAGKITNGRFGMNRLPKEVATKRDLPDTSRFATKQQVDQKTSADDVKRLIRKMVKKESLN